MLAWSAASAAMGQIAAAYVIPGIRCYARWMVIAWELRLRRIA